MKESLEGLQLGGIALALGALFLALVILMAVLRIIRLYRRVPPNKVMIVYGRGRTEIDPESRKPVKRGYRLITGGGTLVWPFFEEVAWLSLEIMTIPMKGDQVYTGPGVPVFLDWVAQIKIGGDADSIATAAQVFLDKSEGEISRIIQETLGGSFREVVGKMTIEEIHSDRDKFAGLVQQFAADEMAGMGLEIKSLTVQEIRDDLGYFEAMGAENVAEVKKKAIIARALADQEARSKAAEANQQAKEAEFTAETKIAEAEKTYKVQQAAFDQEANARRAEADMAGPLRQAELDQELRANQMQIEVVQRQKEIEVQKAEVQRAEKEQQATVIIPATAEREATQVKADAEKYRLETQAAGAAAASRLKGQGEADAAKAQGLAQAEVEKAQGLAQAEASKARLMAEAEGQKMLADAMAAHAEVNLRRDVALAAIDQLPEIVAAAAKPLERIESIRLIDFGGGTNDGGQLQQLALMAPDLAAQVLAKISTLSEAGLGIQNLAKALKGELPEEPVESEPVESGP